MILVLDENNAIPAGTLYQLGFITGEEYREITEQIAGRSAAVVLDLLLDAAPPA